MFAAAYTTAEGNEPLTLDFVFAAGATPVYEFACCELYGLIQVLLPLSAALTPAGAVTSPAPRDPMAAAPQPSDCSQDDPCNDPDND